MNDICLVHLVRKANGYQPLQTFLDSYDAHPAGIGHDLLFVFKGFSEDDLRQYREQFLKSRKCNWISVSDKGFDIGAYFYAARQADYKYLAFLNSFSVICCNEWLLKMYQYIQRPGIGAVGATGSWESLSKKSMIRYKHRWWGKKLAAKLRAYFSPTHFPEFPNYHLRTNAFLISRQLMLKLNEPVISTKAQAHRFESGISGFSAQIYSANLRVLVIGCNGKAYEKEDWASSATFRQGDQGNLMIADNQTSAYLNGTDDERKYLSNAAWGAFITEQATTSSFEKLKPT